MLAFDLFTPQGNEIVLLYSAFFDVKPTVRVPGVQMVRVIVGHQSHNVETQIPIIKRSKLGKI